MPKVQVNQFNGGLDEDIRSHNTNTFYDVGGFDTLTYDHKLVPFGESEAEALSSGDITDKRFTDVYRESNGYITYVGRNGSGSPNAVDLAFKDSGSDISATITAVATASGAQSYHPNSPIMYNRDHYFITTSGTVKKLAVGTYVVSTVATFDFTSSWTGILVPRPLIHPADNICYFAYGYSLIKVDDTGTGTVVTLDFSSQKLISSMADYGNWLAFAVTPTYAGGKSKVLLWDRNTSRTTFTETIDWGDGSLLILENIGGVLVGVSVSDAQYASSTSYTVSKMKKITVRYLSGGQAVIAKEFVVPDTFNLRNFKTKSETKLYFGADNYNRLFVVEKTKEGAIVVSKDRFINNGSDITTLRGISIVGDYLFAMFDTNATSGNIYRTKVTSSYTNTSFYESGINQSMPLSDRAKLKQLVKTYVKTSPLPDGATVTMQYAVDGGAWTDIFSESTNDKITTTADNDIDSANFLEGVEYQFRIESTGGAEITEWGYEYTVIDQSL